MYGRLSNSDLCRIIYFVYIRARHLYEKKKYTAVHLHLACIAGTIGRLVVFERVIRPKL